MTAPPFLNGNICSVFGLVIKRQMVAAKEKTHDWIMELFGDSLFFMISKSRKTMRRRAEEFDPITKRLSDRAVDALQI